jgi:hypothetical protein
MPCGEAKTAVVALDGDVSQKWPHGWPFAIEKMASESRFWKPS